MANKPFELEIIVPSSSPIEVISCDRIGINKEIELDVGINMIEIPISIEPPKPIAMIVELHKMVIPIELNIDYKINGTEYPTYPGPYTVVPKAVDQVLETRDKVMAYDVLVTEVPTYETSNPQGGFTFKILN